MKIEFWWRQIFKNSIIHKPSLGSLDVPQKNLGPIGSAGLTFIGYKQTDKQTNKQTDKPNFYIDCLIILIHYVRIRRQKKFTNKKACVPYICFYFHLIFFWWVKKCTFLVSERILSYINCPQIRIRNTGFNLWAESTCILRGYIFI